MDGFQKKEKNSLMFKGDEEQVFIGTTEMME